MAGTFLNSFETNKALGKSEREELVAAYKDDLCFDDLFTKSDVMPTDIGSILRNYGWFWVNITNTSGSADLIVNDISDDNDPEKAVVRFFDFSRDIIQECNFTDFLLKVKSEGSESVIIRLKKAAREGGEPGETTPFLKTTLENPYPNVSVEYLSYGYTKSNSTRCEVTEGELKVPSQVEHARSRAAQKAVSEGTGDDAGHRIAARFAGPPDISNLARQNRIQNRWGTYYKLEDDWAGKLESGVRIIVRVSDLYKPGAVRPFARRAEWREIYPDGRVIDIILDFANTRSFTIPKAGSPPRLVYSVRPAPFTTNSTPVAIQHRVTAGVLLGIEAITIGIEVYNAITGAIANAQYIAERTKMDSLKELNWWLRFEIVPEIALVEDDAILPGISSQQAYDIINRIGTATNDPTWDKVVITNITADYLDQLAVILSQEVNLGLWMLIVGNPDKRSDIDAQYNVDKVGTVESKLARVNSKWYYKKWDAGKTKNYAYQMPDSCSEKFEELYNELTDVVIAAFKKIPHSELYSITDSGILGIDRLCHAFSSAGFHKEIDFDEFRPRFTKTPYYDFPDFPPELDSNVPYDNINIFAADIDTLYQLTLYKWQLSQDGIPYDVNYTFNNPGIAYIKPDALETYYSTTP